MLVKRDPQRGGEMGGGARPTIEDKETGRMRQRGRTGDPNIARNSLI